MKFCARRNDEGNKESSPREMSYLIRVLLLVGLLLVTAHRLPAAISEVQETPTPTATIVPTAAPTQHPTATPIAGPDSTGAARFAGTWTGKINMEKIGDVEVTLVINADATSLTQSSKLATDVRAVSSTGDSLAWHTGVKNKIAWTLKLNPGGETATATRNFSGMTTTATFKRAKTGTVAHTSPPPRRAKNPKRR